VSLGRLQLPGWFPLRFIFLSYGPQGVRIYQVGFPGDLFSKQCFKFFKGSYFFLVEAENEGSSDQNKTIITSEK